MTLAKNLSKHADSLCYLMSSSWGMLLPAYANPLKSAFIITGKRIKAFNVVQHRSFWAQDSNFGR